MTNFRVQGGPAIKVTEQPAGSKAVGGPAVPAYVIQAGDGYKVAGGPVRSIVVVSDPNYPQVGGPAIPVSIVSGAEANQVEGGPALLVYYLNPPSNTPVSTAPLFVSAEVGAVDANTVVVTFSRTVKATNAATGVTINKGGVGQTISSATIQDDTRIIYYVIAAEATSEDALTWAYNDATGNIVDAITSEPLPTVTAQTLTNNIIGFSLPITANLKVDWDSRYDLWQTSAKTTAATADNDRIGAVDDQSGVGNHLLQATAGLRFTLKLNIQNGYQGIFVDYTGDSQAKYMDCTLVAELTQPYTLYIVGKLDDSTSGGWFCDGTVDSNRCIISRAAASSTSYQMYTGSGYIASTFAAGNMDFITGLVNGASSKLRANGSEIASGNPGSNSLVGLRLGANYGGSNPMHGYFMRVLAYSGAHNAEQIAQVEGYLGTLYNIAFATNTPEEFYAAPPA